MLNIYRMLFLALKKVQMAHGLLNTRPYMSHLKVKINRPVFQKNSNKRTESCIMCCLDLCIQQFFFAKDHIKSKPSEQNFKNINIKNIEMKPPVALFKKESRNLCLLLKAKSQNLINTVVRCLHKEKNAKKNVTRKICQVRVFLK